VKIKIENNNLLMYINNPDLTTKEEIEDYIKELIFRLRKKQKRNVSGFYNVDVYQNNHFGVIIEMQKEDDLDFFPDIIDLKINIKYNANLYVKVEDYFLIKDKEKVYYYKHNYYTDINYLENKELIKLSDFFTIIYGKELEKIKSKLIEIKNNNFLKKTPN